MTTPTRLETLVYVIPLALVFMAWSAWNSRFWPKRSLPNPLWPEIGLHIFFLFYCCLQVSYALASQLDLLEKHKIGLRFVVQILFIFIIAFVLKKFHKTFLSRQVELKRSLFYTLVHFLTLYPLVHIAFALNLQWIGEAQPHPLGAFLKEASLSEVEFILLCLGVSTIVPIIEEILFRGLLQSGLQQFVGFRFAMILQCLAFISLHPLNSWFPLLIFAIALTLVTSWSQSLTPAILMHMIFNGLTCLELSLKRYGNWWA